MKIQSIKKTLYVILFVGCIASFSSCNRGVGCPSDFSLSEVVTKVIQKVAKANILDVLLK